MTFSWGIAACLATSAAVASFGPLALAFWVRRRFGVGLLPFVLGALTFIVSQCVLRLPWQIPLGLWVTRRIAGHPWEQVAWLSASALTAALFEEVGRYVAIRLLVKGERSFRVGVMMGVGHGGIESMLLVGVSLGVTTLLYVALGRGVSLGMDAATTAKVSESFAYLTPAGALAGGVERVLSVPFHVGMSALVMEGFLRNQRKWLAWAICLHFASDAIGVASASWITRSTGSPLLGEGGILPFMLVALWILVRLSRATRPSPSSPSSAVDPRPSL